MNNEFESAGWTDGPYVGPGLAPKRWGRMDALSRLALITVGRTLNEAGLLGRETGKVAGDKCVGLVAGTHHGCLATDLDFVHSLKEGFALASPLLFSYTLPNIALAEAAGQFGLVGPVYAFFGDDAFETAQKEACRWLTDKNGPDIMLAGELEIPPGQTDPGQMEAHFIVLK